MVNFYTAYSKTIDGVTFNFVKHFQTFPEYNNVSPVLKNYGMHPDFNKACKIAMINDKAVQQRLLEVVKKNTCDLESTQVNSSKSYSYNYRTRQLNLQVLPSGSIVRRLLHLKERVVDNYFRIMG